MAGAGIVLRRRGGGPLALLAALLALAAPAHAAPTLVGLGTFEQPTYATSPPGDARVFVTERPGRVMIAGRSTPFLDLTSDVESGYEERGLLSIAFAPDYASSGRFYVYLTHKGDGEIQIREYTRSASDPDVADPASERILVRIAHPDAPNHNGGQLQFGPDGKLYAGTGDGGGSDNQFDNAQDPSRLLGKILTIDTVNGGANVVAMGLRNPWRFSFAPDGRIVIADVGQGQYEEVDVGLAANYGWPCYEGFAPYRTSAMGCDGGPFTPPLFAVSHSTGFCAIVGGYVVRDPGLPTLAGRYVYGDNCNPHVRAVNLADLSTDAPAGIDVPSLSSFGEDACGHLLVVSLAGAVSRVQDGAESPCPPPPAATPAPPTTPAPPAAVDTRPCRLTARVTGLRSLARRRYLSVALRSDEACRVTLTATHFRTRTVALSAGRRAVVRLRLAKARRVRSVRVRMRTVDAAGNRSTLTVTARRSARRGSARA